MPTERADRLGIIRLLRSVACRRIISCALGFKIDHPHTPALPAALGFLVSRLLLLKVLVPCRTAAWGSLARILRALFCAGCSRLYSGHMRDASAALSELPESLRTLPVTYRFEAAAQ